MFRDRREAATLNKILAIVSIVVYEILSCRTCSPPHYRQRRRRRRPRRELNTTTRGKSLGYRSRRKTGNRKDHEKGLQRTLCSLMRTTGLPSLMDTCGISQAASHSIGQSGRSPAEPGGKDKVGAFVGSFVLRTLVGADFVQT